MKKYLLLITFMLGENAFGQVGYCNMNLAVVPDTVNCLDSALLSVKFSASVSCTTYGSPQNLNEEELTQYKICGCLSCGDYAGCGPGAKLMIAVIDLHTFQAWSNNNLNFGQLNQYPGGNCRPRAENFFQFSFTDSSQVDSAASMLTNKVPDGDYVLAYSYEHFDYSLLDTSLAVSFRNLGFNSFDTIKNVPFIYFGQKGTSNTALQVVGLSSTDIINLNETITYINPLPNIVYSWTPCNTLDSCFVSSPVAKPTNTTVYYLSATDTVTHFTLIDSITLVSKCPTAIEAYISDNIISIFPNPATNQLTINNSSLHNEEVMVSVMNVLGQETSPPTPLQMARGDATIYIGNLPAGMYFLQMKTERGSVLKKFIKE